MSCLTWWPLVVDNLAGEARPQAPLTANLVDSQCSRSPPSSQRRLLAAAQSSVSLLLSSWPR